MPKPCSLELRERVVNAVESGASRREAADWFDVSPSSAIKWMQRRQATGSIAPKPSGGSISPLEAHAAFLFALIARRPDLTLDEIVVAMHKRRIAGSRSAGVALLSAAQDQLQKKPAGGRARAGGRPRHAVDPRLSRPQGHRAHGTVHRAIADAVQEFLAGLTSDFTIGASWASCPSRFALDFGPSWRLP
jgi:transposase